MNSEIIKILKNGGIGVLPTDTLYGIVARAFDQKAVERVYKVRKRSPEKPCIILIADIADLEKFGIAVDGLTNQLINQLWPGAVSIVLQLQHSNILQNVRMFEYLHRGTNTLAFRLPADEKLRVLLRQTGPLIAPSANPEGLTPAKTIEEARKYFGSEVDFYEDIDRLDNPPSTLVAIENGTVKVLREGAVKI